MESFDTMSLNRKKKNMKMSFGRMIMNFIGLLTYTDRCKSAIFVWRNNLQILSISFSLKSNRVLDLPFNNKYQKTRFADITYLICYVIVPRRVSPPKMTSLRC